MYSSYANKTFGVEAIVRVGYLHTFATACMNEVEGVSHGVYINDNAYMTNIAA